MGAQVGKVIMGDDVPSNCCAHDYQNNPEIDTEIKKGFKQDKTESKEIQSMMNKYNEIKKQYETEQEEKSKLMQQIQQNIRQYDELLSVTNSLKNQFENELDKYKKQSNELQQEINTYKMPQEKQVTECKTRKLENMKLNDIQTKLENKTKKLEELMNACRNSETSNENENDIENEEINMLKQEINALQKEKRDMEEIQENAFMRDENNKLTNLLNDISQQMEQQKTENERLKKQFKDKIVILQSKLDEFQKQSKTDLNNDEEKHSEKISEIEPTLTKKQSLSENEIQILVEKRKQVEIDKNYKELHAIRSDEKNVTDNRVKFTLEKASTSSDIKAFVFKQYKTQNNIFLDLDDTENDIDESQDDSHDTDSISSLALSEKLEIEQFKRESILKENKLNSENIAMKQQLAQMQNEASFTSTSSDANMPDSKRNLFRFRSDSNWNRDALIKQKNEMEIALVDLVSAHITTSSTKIDTTAVVENNNNC